MEQMCLLSITYVSHYSACAAGPEGHKFISNYLCEGERGEQGTGWIWEQDSGLCAEQSRNAN